MISLLLVTYILTFSNVTGHLICLMDYILLTVKLSTFFFCLFTVGA